MKAGVVAHAHNPGTQAADCSQLSSGASLQARLDYLRRCLKKKAKLGQKDSRNDRISSHQTTLPLFHLAEDQQVGQAHLS